MAQSYLRMESSCWIMIYTVSALSSAAAAAADTIGILQSSSILAKRYSIRHPLIENEGEILPLTQPVLFPTQPVRREFA